MQRIYETITSNREIIIYAAVVATVCAFTASSFSMTSDEGTHSLLSLFYKDVMTNLPEMGFSASRLYDFGLQYLVHYPKLTVTYMPLYHLTVSFFGLLSSAPIFMLGRALSLAFLILSLFLLYKVTYDISGNRLCALTAAMFFSLQPMVIGAGYKVTTDNLTFFLVLVSTYLFYLAIKSGRMKHFMLAGFSAFLLVLSRNFAVFMILAMIIFILLYENKKISKTVSCLGSFALPLLLLAPVYMNPLFLEASSAVLDEARIMPWIADMSPFSIDFWAFYPANLAMQTLGAGLVIAAFGLLHIYKEKEPRIRFLAILLLVSFIVLLNFPHPRYGTYLMIPLSICAAIFLSKRKLLHAIPLIIILIVASGIHVYGEYESSGNKLEQGQVISEFIYGKGGNIALLSDEPVYSSVYIYYIASWDHAKDVYVFRPCNFMFDNETLFMEKIKEKGIKSVVVNRGNIGERFISGINGIELEKEFAFGNETVAVYNVPGFTSKQVSCTMICVMGREVCANSGVS